MTDEEIKSIVLKRGIFDQEENTRIYYKAFHNWASYNGYIFKKFDIKFTERILDIGSNFGHNLIHFRSDSVGIETLKRAVDFSRALGLNIVETNVEDKIEINDRFDLVWCSDFLVHLVSPYKFIYEVRKLLTDNGRLMIQIPLMSVFNMHPSPQHFYAFNKKSLIYLLNMAGFKVIKSSGCIRRQPDWFNKLFEPLLQYFGGNIWILCKKSEVKIDFDKVYLPQWFKK